MTDLSERAPLAAGRPSGRSLSDWRRILADAWKEAGSDNLSLIAAGVAFYAFLAFVPLLTAFVLSYGLFAEPASVVRHMQTLTSVMPQDAAGIIGNQLESMTETSGTQTGLALLVSVGIALYGASKGAGSVITALNVVFEVEEVRGLIRRTLVALAMTIGAVVVLLFAILAVSALNLVEALLPDLGGLGQVLLKSAFFLLAGAAVILLLALVYRFGPNRPDAPWRWITPGSLLAALIWLAATAGFGLYVANFGSYNATYGSLGAVIVFLTWLYLTAYILLLGAELNAVLEFRSNRVGEVRRKPISPAGPGLIPARSAASAEPGRDHGSCASDRRSPSLGAVAARIGFLSVLIRLLGRRRRRVG